MTKNILELQSVATKDVFLIKFVTTEN